MSISIQGIVPASDDATLSGLAVTADAADAITLTPTFASGTTEYRAWVANDVTPVTLTATKNDSNATVAITGDDDAATPGEAEFDLDEGANTLEVVVTAEDGVATETYTVTVVREAAAPMANPDAVWTANLTVGVVEVGGITISGYTPGTLSRPGFGAVAPLSFDVDSKEINVVGLSYDSTSLNFSVSATDPDATLGGQDWALLVGTESFIFSDPVTTTTFEFTDHGLDWTHGDVVLVGLSNPPPEVTIAADAGSAIYLEDASAFTLTRTGATTDVLTVTVDFTQDGLFVADGDLSKTVTFAVGSATAALSVEHQLYPKGKAIASGTLVATVADGTEYDVGTAGAADMAIVVALLTGFDMDSYSLNEEAGTLDVKLVARTGVGAAAPDANVVLSISSKPGTEYDEEFPAFTAEDYGAVSATETIEPADFPADGNVFKAEKTISVPIIDDTVDEDDETFFIILESTPGLSRKHGTFVDASGGVTCDPRNCATPITIIDTDPVSADIESLAFTSAPASGNYYKTGETVSCPLAPAHPTHRLPQKVGGAPSGDGPALAQPGHQHIAGASGHGQQRVIAPLAGVTMMARSLLCQPVGLADGGVQVDGQRPVAGSGTGGPGPGQQLPAHPVQLADMAPPEAAQERPQSLPSRKRGVEGALTMHPSTEEVRPARSASASSMQSPPASAEATSVSILSPAFARPGASPRSR